MEHRLNRLIGSQPLVLAWDMDKHGTWVKPVNRLSTIPSGIWISNDNIVLLLILIALA
jgi:hypothetical protein